MGRSRVNTPDGKGWQDALKDRMDPLVRAGGGTRARRLRATWALFFLTLGSDGGSGGERRGGGGRSGHRRRSGGVQCDLAADRAGVWCFFRFWFYFRRVLRLLFRGTTHRSATLGFLFRPRWFFTGGGLVFLPGPRRFRSRFLVMGGTKISRNKPQKQPLVSETAKTPVTTDLPAKAI